MSPDCLSALAKGSPALSPKATGRSAHFPPGVANKERGGLIEVGVEEGEKGSDR